MGDLEHLDGQNPYFCHFCGNPALYLTKSVVPSLDGLPICYDCVIKDGRFDEDDGFNED
jgi:hypothetical protein